MAGDWLKLHRSIVDSPVFADDWLTRLFIWCLCRANYRDANFRGQLLKRGQFITGRNSAAAELGVAPSKWYRGIERLVDLGNISVEANNNWTTITVCKFGTYQSLEEETEQQPNSNRTATGQRSNSNRTAIEQQSNTIEEGKNSIREEGKKERSNTNGAKPRVQFDPPTVEQVNAYCQERGNRIDAEAFVAYYAKQGWRLANGRVVTDWKSCVITWEKRDKQHPRAVPERIDPRGNMAALEEHRRRKAELFGDHNEATIRG